MQQRPDRERQALVGDLLGRDVLEEVGPILFAVQRHQVGRAQDVELVHDLVQVPSSG